MRIFVIVPTYNESLNISKTINILLQIAESVKEDDVNILVSDANSPDGTAKIVKSIKNKKLHLIEEPKKQGIGRAYVDAMAVAFNDYKADAVITFDADLSHDPKKIPQFITKLKEGYKQVNGTRYKKGGGIPDNWGIHRKFLSITANAFISLLFFEFHLSDFTSGYKAVTKEVFENIKRKLSKHDGYTFSISLNLESLFKGYKIAEIPYHFKDREFGQSKLGFEYIINGLKYVFNMRIKLLFRHQFIKVFIAGGCGGLSQLLTFALIFKPLIEDILHFALPEDTTIIGFTIHLKLLLAQLLSMEIGILVSFIINNMWSFKDKKLVGMLFLRRYIKNHVVVAGAIVIQLIIVQILSNITGRNNILDIFYQIIGILFGLIWNFYFYKKVIWKTQKT